MTENHLWSLRTTNVHGQPVNSADGRQARLTTDWTPTASSRMVQAMETTETLRARYERASDDDLRAILDAGTTQMAPDARAILMTEVRRRRMLGDVNPLDRLAWPAEVPEVPRYSKVKFRRRLGARLLDSFVPALPMLGFLLLAGLGAIVGGVGGILALLGFLGAFVSVFWGMYYAFTKDGRERGQSIGKKKLNLMVVNITTNKPCTKGESALRELDLFFLQMVPIVGWLVEPIVMLASKDGRRLGDHLADTQVIDVTEYRR